jgi:hypothetical protein
MSTHDRHHDRVAGLLETDRIAAVCADLGIGAVKAHNLRRQVTLPQPIRARVAVAGSARRVLTGQFGRGSAHQPSAEPRLALRSFTQGCDRPGIVTGHESLGGFPSNQRLLSWRACTRSSNTSLSRKQPRASTA